MRVTRRQQPRQWRRGLAGLAALLLLAAACGDDDDGATTPDDAIPDEPQSGGELTLIYYLETETLDPVAATGSGGAGANQLFMAYGALVTLIADEDRIEPLMASSFEPNDDFTTWTLTLQDGIGFTDGAEFDAAAVQANWERSQDPANRPPAFVLANSITEMEADGLTLTISLEQPNAHFDKAVERSSLNYIASPDAIASGHDLSDDPVGAGPFTLERWVRDDRMVFERNPDWFDSPRPYLDRVTIRVVPDLQQQRDTFATGDADGLWTTEPAAIDEMTERVEGVYDVTVFAGGTPAYAFNTQAPPFDDPRMREAAIMAVDREFLAEIVPGEGGPVTDNYSVEGTPWYTEAAQLPDYDPEAAQELVDEIVAEQDGPIEIEVGGFTGGTADQMRVEFIQTSLNDLDGVEATVNLQGMPEVIPRMLEGDFQMHSWGFPFFDPEPGLYSAAHSGQLGNFSRYENPDVDEALDAARRTRDQDERAELYHGVFEQLAEDLPWMLYREMVFGWILTPQIHDAEIYGDGILRYDLFWRSG
jgi:peptide/nickel transport system substrate-binding protein